MEEIEGVQDFLNEKAWNRFDWYNDIASSIPNQLKLILFFSSDTRAEVIVDRLIVILYIKNYRREGLFFIVKFVFNEAVLKCLHIINK